MTGSFARALRRVQDGALDHALVADNVADARSDLAVAAALDLLRRDVADDGALGAFAEDRVGDAADDGDVGAPGTDGEAFDADLAVALLAVTTAALAARRQSSRSK